MSVMRIGPFSVSGILAAPMAGVTDRPFRFLARRLGAALAVGEMVSCDARLWGTEKSRRRIDHEGEPEPRAVQIAGADPRAMADAARYNADRGAQIIDVNMGCPAKKVCNALAGSALLSDEGLVTRILEAVVAAVDVPVTLKMRTGPDPDARNGVTIARIAAAAGVAAVAVHGRTRACAFRGEAEHATTRAIKAAVSIPVVANGDITTPEEARRVLDESGADALMIGRAAQGNPWIFGEIAHFLAHGRRAPGPSAAERARVLGEHLVALYGFYGEHVGVRVARKHLGWYCRGRPGGEAFWRGVNGVESARVQLEMAREFLSGGTDPEGGMDSEAPRIGLAA